MGYLALFLFFVAVAAVVYGISKGVTVRKVEADLREWLVDAQKARNLAEGEVKAHYVATVAKVNSFLTKYFKL